MKLLLSLILFVQSQQVLLFDVNDNAVGSLSTVGDTMFIKINNYPPETFEILYNFSRGEGEYYRIKNIKAEGWVIVKPTIVMIDLIVNKTYYFNDTYYRPNNR